MKDLEVAAEHKESDDLVAPPVMEVRGRLCFWDAFRGAFGAEELKAVFFRTISHSLQVIL